jgi:alkylation response protein AidB-like acyl-CoA dehydrogenase
VAEKFVGERNLKFMLYEVFDVESLTQAPLYAEHNKDIFDLVVETALKLARDLLKPNLQEMDKQPPVYRDGRIKAHPVVREFMKTFGEGGWIGAGAPFERGGQQLPLTIAGVCRFIFSAANYSASVYPLLTGGAAHLIESFGSQELIDTYLPAMFAGKWQGTMALTEPQAGSSLADIATSAEPTPAGDYKIRGQKIFISAGDHDGVDNVVHLMLAKIKGGPPGVKGISLFVVPHKRLDADGALVPNDVAVAGTYHKLGYRGAPIVQLSLGENGDCRGHLVGEPHKGLSYMFQMMNEARIDVGIGAAAIASAAYYASLQYAEQRPQGRKIHAKDPSLPPVPIIEHPDVKRMLLFQRAIVEGSLSLALQCSYYADRMRVSDEGEGKRCALLLDLLTPVAKSYPSEMGILSVSAGLQCLGGYGYCDEFPLEQYYRDARIHPIHEGTTGIQGLDLLGRKVRMHRGLAFEHYLEEVARTVQGANAHPDLLPYARELANGLETLRKVTAHLVGLAEHGDIELFLADSTLYLEFFGIIAVAWQWLRQAVVIREALDKSPTGNEQRFYEGKWAVFRYFYGYELPKIYGLAKCLTESDGLTVHVGPEAFWD